MAFDAIGTDGIAKRAVSIVDGDGMITHARGSDDPGIEPDYDEVAAAARDAAARPVDDCGSVAPTPLGLLSPVMSNPMGFHSGCRTPSHE